jgi:hypothetical protein
MKPFIYEHNDNNIIIEPHVTVNGQTMPGFSKLLARNAKLLVKLAKLPKYTKNSKHKNCILKLGKDGVDAITECNLNILKNNVKLKKCDFNKLKKHKKQMLQLYKLGQKRSKGIRQDTTKLLTAKKRVINQKGGFLTALLGPILGSILIPLAERLFRKH